MEYRELGKTGLSVSAISLGCEGFMGKSAEEVCADFDFAIAHGINFLDLYGSEPNLRSNIGRALAGRRENFIIQGHLCSTWEEGQYLRTRDMTKAVPAFEDQLARLQTDYLDIGMIHYVDSPEDYDAIVNGPILSWALQLKEQGRIRHIGLSSHNPVVAKRAAESGVIEVLMFSINPAYDLQPPTDDVEKLFDEESYAVQLQNIDPVRESLYELCERTGVGIDVMKVYGGGDLLSVENSPFGQPLTPVQCIEYVLTRPGVAAAMIGCRSIAEMQAALDWCTASPQERDYASVMSSLKRFSWKGHCMYCGHCAPCTVGINIADVNKFYNLTGTQGEIPETVREHYKSLTRHASECVACGACESRCPFGVPIVEQMRKAAERFGY